MSHSLAARTYAEQLRMHGFGEPLWQPEPPDHDGEVLIGDVGFIEDGRFYRFFNACLPADDPVNSASGVPEGYVPLQYNERHLLQKNENYHGPTPIYSKSVSTSKVGVGAGSQGLYASYKFMCKSEKGTVLIPGDDITLWHVQRNKYFQEYIRLYHDSWHQFALAQGRIIEAEEIVLVTGFLKTSEWAVAALTNHSKGHAVSFSAQGAQVAQAEFSLDMSDAIEMSVSQRSGPKRGDVDPEITRRRDQCLFLKYYKAKRSRFLGQKLIANAEPQDMHDPEDSEWIARLRGLSFDSTSSVSVEELPFNTSLKDPLNNVLDYILEHSSAEMAVVGHDDLYDFWRDTNVAWPEDFHIFLAESGPNVRSDEHQVGHLSPHDRRRSINLISTSPARTSLDLPNRSTPSSTHVSPSEVISHGPLSTQPSEANAGSYMRPPFAGVLAGHGGGAAVAPNVMEKPPQYSTISATYPTQNSPNLMPPPPLPPLPRSQNPSTTPRWRTSSQPQPHHQLPASSADERFPCDKCEQSFPHAYDRKRHYELVHAYTRTHTCRYCHQDFGRATALTQHLDSGCESEPLHDTFHRTRLASLMHWQLLPPNPSLGKMIVFDMAFSVRRILKYVGGRSEPFEPVDRQKPAALATRLASMTVVCHELRDWKVVVEKPGSVTCGDVFEAIYLSLNAVLTPLDLEQYVVANKRVDVEDAFAQRCEDLAARGKDVEGEVKRWIDLLRGRRMFAGLKVVSWDTWDLQVADSIVL